MLTNDVDMFGTVHRTCTDILELKEMKSFILDLECMGAFEKGRELPCSWASLRNSTWFHFRLELHGITHYREKQWKTWPDGVRHQIAKRIVGGVLKILSVRCPNPQCAERFALIVGILLSGIHFNHRGVKSINYGKVIHKKGFEPFRTELVKGDGDCICAFCHGKVNQCQKGKRDVKDGEEWILPSLGKTIAKK